MRTRIALILARMAHRVGGGSLIYASGHVTINGQLVIRGSGVIIGATVQPAEPMPPRFAGMQFMDWN